MVQPTRLLPAQMYSSLQRYTNVRVDTNAIEGLGFDASDIPLILGAPLTRPKQPCIFRGLCISLENFRAG